MQDDILDLYGDKQRDEVGCDLKEGKVSLLVVCHLRRNPERLAAMKALLHRHRADVSSTEVTEIKQQFSVDGTLQMALDELRRQMTATYEHELLQKEPALARLVTGLVTDIVEPIQHLWAKSSSDPLPMGVSSSW